MNQQERYCLVFYGPSGVGKTSLIQKLKKNFNISFSVSHTTRKKRENEMDGVDYYFTDKKIFNEIITKDEFFEYTQYNNNYYGTSKEAVKECLKNQNCIFDLDLNGINSFHEKLPYNAYYIYIQEPSIKELESRLRARNEEEDVIRNRISKTIEDKKLIDENKFDKIIINNNFDEAYVELYNFVNSIKIELI